MLPVNMEPGTHGIINIKNPQKIVLANYDLTNIEDATFFFHAYGKSCEWSVLTSTFVVMRPNKQYFAKDFFLPNCFHTANKVDEFSDRLLAYIVSFLLDIFTIPCRAATLPFRAVYLSMNINHLANFIGEDNAESEEIVIIELYYQTVSIDKENARRIYIHATIPIAIKPVPQRLEAPKFSCKKEKMIWEEEDGETGWRIINTEKEKSDKWSDATEAYDRFSKKLNNHSATKRPSLTVSNNS